MIRSSPTYESGPLGNKREEDGRLRRDVEQKIKGPAQL